MLVIVYAFSHLNRGGEFFPETYAGQAQITVNDNLSVQQSDRLVP